MLPLWTIVKVQRSCSVEKWNKTDQNEKYQQLCDEPIPILQNESDSELDLEFVAKLQPKTPA